MAKLTHQQIANEVFSRGYELIDETGSICAIGDCVLIECEVVFEYSDIAGQEVVMLNAKKIHKLPKEENKVLGM